MDKRIRNTIKALTQLRFSELASYGVYQFQKTLGLFRFSTPMKSRNKDLGSDCFIPADFLLLPPEVSDHLTEKHKQSAIQKAERVISGQIQVFGAQERDLNLSPVNASTHWSEVRRADLPAKDFDIKDIWEPARFMWAVTLAQAFSFTGENVYAEFFFNKVKEFNQNNPYNKGPNWESAQEVGLRLIALLICASAFASQYRSTSPEMLGLLRLIADHADRIPPTLSYAIAQNNNHLLSESVALYTAGVFLPAHPRAARWKKLGMKWFKKGLSRQIMDDGQYVQYSNNYHRMMLMLALWINRMHNLTCEHLTQESTNKLKIATTWLFNELDPESGRVSNYGHNDGSFILPFSTCAFEDYRPVIQASAIAFHGREFLPPGPWDDLAQWLGLGKPISKDNKANDSQDVSQLRVGNQRSWGVLRASKFNSRPAHADQLHVDLWFDGRNITLDPGTYRYNFPPPWDNGLAQTRVHNTVTINNENQMTLAGKFLWLDWAQANVLEKSSHSVSATHSGYDRGGYRHTRTLSQVGPEQWQIIDEIIPFNTKKGNSQTRISLQWLLPDWDQKISSNAVEFTAPFGRILLSIVDDSKIQNAELHLVRAGKNISKGNFTDPLLGWHSPTYSVRNPAISIVYAGEQELPVKLTTTIMVIPHN